MRSESSEERLGAFAAEEMHEGFCRRESYQAEAREQERMRCKHVQRAEDFSAENGPTLGEGLHQAAPTIAVGCESRFGGAQIALEGYGGAIVKRMGEGSR